jgi:ankyrin repeat protein
VFSFRWYACCWRRGQCGGPQRERPHPADGGRLGRPCSVARILLKFGAGINTHSNEFKESALTLACYKGHLEMVRFLLEAGTDQEHKTDEMHTALMEASMDGHVEVARLLLDSGAQVLLLYFFINRYYR